MERPCARSVKVDCPCVFSQVCVRGGVVWALSEHKALFYREGLNSYCSEGEGWKYDTVRYYHYSDTTVVLYYCTEVEDWEDDIEGISCTLLKQLNCNSFVISVVSMVHT